MLIGIDASRANKPKKTGVEWYSYHLIEQLKKIDKKNHYFLYTNTPLIGELAICPENFEQCLLSWPLPRFWTLGRLSYEMKFGRKRPDVLFVPAHTIPLLTPKKTVVTIHDIGFEHYPELYKWPDKIYHKFTVRFIKRFATKIITISRFSKQDLMDTYNIPERKIKVIYNGYDSDRYKILAKDSAVLKRYKIMNPFILFIGRLEEKKNVIRLVEAFALLKKKNPKSHFQLVLVGAPGYGYEKIQQKVAEYRLINEVIFLGWLDSSELPQLLNQATVFAFPSLFEGFGIPILEAFACGCPVICSNSTSLSEVAGEAALMFNPLEAKQMVNRLEQVVLNVEVQDSLREKGFQQIRNFSWRQCAEETLTVLESVMGV